MKNKKLPGEPTDGDVVAATEQFIAEKLQSSVEITSQLAHGADSVFIKETAAARLRFEVYPDAAGESRWRLVAANGRIVAVSGEGYKNRSDCHYAITLVQGSHIADVIDVEN